MFATKARFGTRGLSKSIPLACQRRCQPPEQTNRTPGPSQDISPPTTVRVVHRRPACLCGRGLLKRSRRKRIWKQKHTPSGLKSGTTERTIRNDWFSTCKKKVEPFKTDASPCHRTIILSSWFRLRAENTTSQIAEFVNGDRKLKDVEGASRKSGIGRPVERPAPTDSSAMCEGRRPARRRDELPEPRPVMLLPPHRPR
jgi:hypothetical protein